MLKRVALLLWSGALLAWEAPCARAGSYQILHSFQDGNDGAISMSAPVSVHGTLFGTTLFGGSTKNKLANGTVYSVDPSTGVEQVVHAFTKASDAAVPAGSPLLVGNILYGLSLYGGEAGVGTVYRIDPSTGAEKVAYSFAGGHDGSNPSGSLIEYGGLLYGVTLSGGGSTNCNGGCGTVFAFDPKTGLEKVVYAFQGGTDGAEPGRLIELGGKLYGATYVGGGLGDCDFGGVPGCGTVFALDPGTGSERVLHAFQGGQDGLGGEIVISVNGLLYGTTLGGGGQSCSCGTVFSVDPTTGDETVVYSFKGGRDGNAPYDLVESNGLLYGTTREGGKPGKCISRRAGCGTVFSLNPTTGAEQVVYVFGGGTSGWEPTGLLAVDGTLFGTTYGGGTATGCKHGCGVLYSITP